MCLSALLIFSACTERVDVSLPNGGNRLVVEASINWEKGTDGKEQLIKLSESTEFFSPQKSVPVKGAVVRVKKNDDGSIFNFADQANGEYKAIDFAPEIGKTYTLEIEYEGKFYEAQETMLSVADIEKIEQATEDILGTKEILIKVFYSDPEDEKNFYLSEMRASVSPIPSIQVLDDEFTNGKENSIEHESDLLKPGQEVELSLFGISKGYYNYMDILVSQLGGQGNPFPTTPVQLKGNCRNVNDPNEQVLGFFRLSQVAKMRYTVK